MAFTVVSSAAVEIVPEKSKTFDEQLRAMLTKVRQTVKARVQLDKGSMTKALGSLGKRVRLQVDADALRHGMTRDVQKVIKQLPSMVLTASLSPASVQRVRAQLRAVVRDAASKPIHLNLDVDRARVKVDADTGDAEDEIDHLARHRRSKMTVKVDVDRSAMRALQASMRSVSNMATRMTGVDGLTNSVKRLFQSITPGGIAKIGALSGALMIGGSGVSILAGNLLTVAASLGQLGGLAVPMPGLFAAFGAAAKTLAWAIEDIAVQAPELVESWKGLKVAVSENFWDKARDPILKMTRELMPKLKSAWSDTASAMGEEAGHLADAMSKALGGDYFEKFFGYISDGAKNLRPAFQPAVQGLADLVDFGASQLPKLAQWAGEIAGAAGTAMSKAADDGTMQRLLDTGLAALKDLWRAADGLFGAVGGIAKAAAEAGGSTLSTMADGLQRLSETINSPAFQKGLTRAFVAARQTLDQFFDAAGPGLERFVLGIMDTFAEVGPALGRGLGDALGGLASLLGSSGVQSGLQTFLRGIADAGSKVGPIFSQLEPVLGPLLGLLGQMAQKILPVLAQGFVDLLGGLMPAFEVFLSLAQDLAPVLVDALTMIADAIGQVFSDPKVVEALHSAVQALADAVVELAPHMPNLVQSFVDMLPAAVAFGQFLLSVLVPALGFLMDNVGWILPLLAGLVTAFKLVGVAAGIGLAISGPVGIAIGAIGLLVAAIAGIATHWEDVKRVTGEAMNWINETVGKAIEKLAEWVAGAISGLGDAFGGLSKIPVIGGLFEQSKPGPIRELDPSQRANVVQNFTINNPNQQSTAQDMSHGARQAAAVMPTF